MTELAPLGRNCEGGNPLMSRDRKEFQNPRGEAAADVQRAIPEGILQRDRCQSALPSLRHLSALRKEIINIRAGINEKEIKEAIAKINKSKTGRQTKLTNLSQHHQETKGEDSNQ